MKKNPKRTPVEATIILQNLDSEILTEFVALSDTKTFEKLEIFARRYVETMKNQIIDLPTEDERKLANEIAIRKGKIFAAGVIIEVIKGAKSEIARRKEG